jgi:putative DNA primase/helicase
MTDNVEGDVENVKLVEHVRKLMAELSAERGKTAAMPILEDAIGLDDFTNKLRLTAELTPAELVEASFKLKAALERTNDDADDLDAKIRKINDDLKGEVFKGRPTVLVTPSYLPRAIARTERLILNEAKTVKNVRDRIFQRDGKLVRLSRNLLAPGVAHDDGYRENNALLIVEVKPKWLANRLERTIQFIGPPVGKPKQDEKPKSVPKNVSAELVARMIEDSTNWRHPHLFGTIEAPTLRPDGTVLDTPGYDKATGLFFDPGETVFPKIPNKPSFDDGVAAIQMIEELLCDFPFQDAPGYEGVSKAVALAAILTGPVRRTLDIAPAFAVTAKEAETGKTELCKFILGVMVGREISGQPFSDSEEERRKAIGANLRNGRPGLFFDNADNVTIEGDFMEKMVTLPFVTDRILTTMEEYTAPTNTLILFNGNHISVGGAMTTRVLLSRIVTDTPLAKRTFIYPDLFKYVVEHRAELVAAVLTALRAWLVHGVPEQGRDTSRFPQWDRLVAQALVWYGYADPARGGDELREVDPVKEAKREVVRAWAAAFGDKTITAVELQKHAVVREAIASARGRHEREITPTVVGRYVGTIEDVRLDLDWRVVRSASAHNKSAQWRLEFIGEGEPPPVIDSDDTTAVDDFGAAG